MLVPMGSIIPNAEICDEEMFLFYCQLRIEPAKMK